MNYGTLVWLELPLNVLLFLTLKLNYLCPLLASYPKYLLINKIVSFYIDLTEYLFGSFFCSCSFFCSLIVLDLNCDIITGHHHQIRFNICFTCMHELMGFCEWLPGIFIFS